MKKLIGILLVTVLLMNCFATVAFAAESTTLQGAVKVPAEAGQTVDVAFTVNEATYAAYGYVVTCDDELTITRISAGEASKAASEDEVISFISNKDNGKVGASSTQNVTKSGVLFTVTVQVAADAKPGEYFIYVAKSNGMRAATGEYVNETILSGSVNVVCNHTPDTNGWYKDADNHWHVCSKCGSVFDSAEHDHKLISDTATCGADGVKTYECSVCGHTYTEESKATNAHDYKLISDTATCGKDGKKTYECSVCKHTYEEDSKATGNHDHKLISDTATCGKDGKKTYKCSVCGDTYEVNSAATGKHTYGDWKVTKAATCTTDGSKERVCSVCGHKETAVIDKAGAHTWDNGKVTKEPTCTEEGVKTYTCTKCGATKTEAIKATGHKISTEWATDKDNHWHECSVCGEKIDVEKHSFEWIVDKKATASETGLKHEECATCHYKRNVGTVIPKVEGLDDVPQTGDITPHITFGVAALIGLFGAVAYVFKRKAAK